MKCLRRNDDAMKTMAGISTGLKPRLASFSKRVAKYKTYLLSLFLKANNNKLQPAAHNEKNICLPYFSAAGTTQLLCASFFETAGS